MAINPAYDYLPPDIEIPALYETEGQRDEAKALIKLFTPDSNWTWYIIEIDTDKDLCYGLAVGFEAELGYFTLSEIREARGALGLQPERDLNFEPTTVRELREQHS
jgi:hypothetical protein